MCVLLLLFLSSKLLPVHVLGRFFFCFLFLATAECLERRRGNHRPRL